jgi:MFS transporter, FSR family, fosmidomycin resistance protein
VTANASTASTQSEQDPHPTTRLDLLRNRPLMTLMLGHYTVDMYSGIIPFLYPLLTDKFNLSLGTVGFVSLAYSGASSISQPLFGMVADRKGIRYIGLALMWTGFMFSILGFATSFPMLLLLAACAGLGSGAYHPMGALGANAAISAGQRNVAMSLYVTGGTLGVACGPLIGATLFHFFGLHGTAAMFIPGVGISIWMLIEMRNIAKVAVRRQAIDVNLPPIPWRPMAIIIGLMMMRSWTMSSLQAYIPTWYEELGYGAGFYGLLTTTLLLSSVVGTIGSGSLADKHGRKILMIVSSVATVPAVFLFAQFPGWFGFVSAAMIGLMAASTGPLLLVMAQQLMHGRAGVASGLILGLGFVMGAIGVPIVGAIADHIGIQAAFRVQAVIASGAIILAVMLPSERRMTEIINQPERAPA